MYNIDFDVIIVNMEGHILNSNYKSVIVPDQNLLI
jgi:hypothetical protein